MSPPFSTRCLCAAAVAAVGHSPQPPPPGGALSPVLGEYVAASAADVVAGVGFLDFDAFGAAPPAQKPEAKADPFGLGGF